jgi:hypothetical protein
MSYNNLRKRLIFYFQLWKIIRDVEKDKKPELVKLWNTIKEADQNHLKMLRSERANQRNKSEQVRVKRWMRYSQKLCRRKVN